MFCFFRKLLNEAYIANVPFTESARTFISCKEFLIFFFAFLISEGFNYQILGARQGMLSVLLFDITELNHFSDAWFQFKVKYIFHNFRLTSFLT